MRVHSAANINRIMGAYGKNVARVDKTKKSSFPTDKIEISTQAKEFQVAMKAFGQLPDIREDKVAVIKEQINNGTYKPSSDDVVKKMLENIIL